MTTETTTAPPELTTRSLDAGWNNARWSQLPDDGNRYEVIDGVLYMTTAPSFFHQWIASRIIRMLQTQIEDPGVGLVAFAPIGLLMPGCDPVQPDIVVVRSEDRGMIYDRRINGVPALIVEVLSPGNAEKDTAIKRAAGHPGPGRRGPAQRPPPRRCGRRSRWRRHPAAPAAPPCCAHWL